MSWFDYVLQRVWKTAPKANSTSKDDLYIASMKSMIMMQQDIIAELRKTNEHYRALLEAKDAKLEDIGDIVPAYAPPRVFKPLREGVELPSQRRARLTQKYRDLAAAEQSKKGKEESNGKEV